MPSRGLSVLAAITTAVVLVCWFATAHRHSKTALSTTQERGLVFPQFQHQLPNVTDIEVARANDSFVLSRSGDAWANMGLGGFPALSERVENVLIAMASMKYIAPKTGRSKLHHRLDVEDVNSTAQSTRLTFKDSTGVMLADVIIGKSKNIFARRGVYVRLPDDNQTWLAEGSFDVRHNMIEWSDRVVADLDARFMKAITVYHLNRETISLYRKQPQDRKMKLKNLPVGATIENQYQIDYIAGLLQDLNFMDAKRADEQSPGANPAFSVVTHWNGQLAMILHTGEPMADGAVWARIKAWVVDNSQASGFEKQEAARIQSKFDGWSVKLPRKFTERIKIRMEDIVRPGAQ